MRYCTLFRITSITLAIIEVGFQLALININMVSSPKVLMLGTILVISSPSINIFKKPYTDCFRVNANSIFIIHDPLGIKSLRTLRNKSKNHSQCMQILKAF